MWSISSDKAYREYVSEGEILPGDVKIKLDSLEEEPLTGIILIEEEDSRNEKDWFIYSLARHQESFTS